MITIKDILEKTIVFFRESKVNHATKEARVVISDALDVKPLDLYLMHDRPLNELEVQKCRDAVSRRVKGEPSQYIRGSVTFYDCIFHVDERVLIPRMETEILVDLIVKELENEDLQNKTLWDICTGSGCIGISIKKKLPELQVVLSDLSQDALAVARKNADTNNVDVQFVQGDLLKPFKGNKTDFVVSNPPYVTESEYHTLSAEIKDFEPKIALVPGISGLECYQTFSEELPDYLNPGAKVWMEVGFNQGDAVVEIFSGKNWENVHFKKDWGGNDRFFYANYRKTT